MYAARFHQPGSPDVVRYEEVETPSPGPGEVLVEVRAAAMNHLDLWVRRGLPIETTMPHIGGSDIAGVVVAAGDAVHDCEPGTRVVVNPLLTCGRCRECRRGEESLCPRLKIIGEHTNGGFAEYVAVPRPNVYEVPEDVDFEMAACLPVSYQTAWRAVVTQARVRPGEDVLILGASGGTAIAVLQVALLAGARIHAVTSGAENMDWLRRLGAEFVYDREVANFSAAAFEQTHRRGVDVVVDGVGSAVWKDAVRALAPGGRLVTYGATTGHTVELDLRRIFWRQLRILGSTMASRGEFEAMLRSAWAGQLRPVVDSRFALSDAAAAHTRLESGEHFGKILLLP